MRGNRSSVSACDTSQTGSCQAGAATRPGLAQTAQQLLIVWLYFLLGRAWQSEIHSDDTLPFLTARLLRRNQVRRIRDALRAHGSRLVVLARFAIFPTGLLAATAGASGMKPARYFPADGLAFAAAAGLVVGAGYSLGLAQRESDLWLTVIGTAGLTALSGLLRLYVRREPKQRS
jgi:membrane protein DedA with SNARE-associated domain